MAILSANLAVSNYLEGKGFEPDSSDYRYYYYTITEQLTDSLDDMPSWYRIAYADPWS